jgi:hypothetical protein
MIDECSICKEARKQMIKQMENMKDVLNCKHGDVDRDGTQRCDYQMGMISTSVCHGCDQWAAKR